MTAKAKRDDNEHYGFLILTDDIFTVVAHGGTAHIVDVGLFHFVQPLIRKFVIPLAHKNGVTKSEVDFFVQGVVACARHVADEGGHVKCMWKLGKMKFPVYLQRSFLISGNEQLVQQYTKNILAVIPDEAMTIYEHGLVPKAFPWDEDGKGFPGVHHHIKGFSSLTHGTVDPHTVRAAASTYGKLKQERAETARAALVSFSVQLMKESRDIGTSRGLTVDMSISEIKALWPKFSLTVVETLSRATLCEPRSANHLAFVVYGKSLVDQTLLKNKKDMKTTKAQEAAATKATKPILKSEDLNVQSIEEQKKILLDMYHDYEVNRNAKYQQWEPHAIPFFRAVSLFHSGMLLGRGYNSLYNRPNVASIRVTHQGGKMLYCVTLKDNKGTKPEKEADGFSVIVEGYESPTGIPKPQKKSEHSLVVNTVKFLAKLRELSAEAMPTNRAKGGAKPVRPSQPSSDAMSKVVVDSREQFTSDGELKKRKKCLIVAEHVHRCAEENPPNVMTGVWVWTTCHKSMLVEIIKKMTIESKGVYECATIQVGQKREPGVCRVSCKTPQTAAELLRRLRIPGYSCQLDKLKNAAWVLQQFIPYANGWNVPTPKTASGGASGSKLKKIDEHALRKYQNSASAAATASNRNRMAVPTKPGITTLYRGGHQGGYEAVWEPPTREQQDTMQGRKIPQHYVMSPDEENSNFNGNYAVSYNTLWTPPQDYKAEEQITSRTARKSGSSSIPIVKPPLKDAPPPPTNRSGRKKSKANTDNSTNRKGSKGSSSSTTSSDTAALTPNNIHGKEGGAGGRRERSRGTATPPSPTDSAKSSTRPLLGISDFSNTLSPEVLTAFTAAAAALEDPTTTAFPAVSFQPDNTLLLNSGMLPPDGTTTNTLNLNSTLTPAQLAAAASLAGLQNPATLFPGLFPSNFSTDQTGLYTPSNLNGLAAPFQTTDPTLFTPQDNTAAALQSALLPAVDFQTNPPLFTAESLASFGLSGALGGVEGFGFLDQHLNPSKN